MIMQVNSRRKGEKMRLVWDKDISEMTVTTRSQAVAEMLAIDCTRAGAEIMADKMLFKVVKVNELDTRAANLLKQAFLAKGGEVAVSRDSCNLAAATTDCLIMATVAQIKAVVPKLKMQPWGLKDLAVKLEELLETV